MKQRNKRGGSGVVSQATPLTAAHARTSYFAEHSGRSIEEGYLFLLRHGALRGMSELKAAHPNVTFLIQGTANSAPGQSESVFLLESA